MNTISYKECIALLNAWFEEQDFAEQGTFGRARWAVKQLAADLGLEVGDKKEQPPSGGCLINGETKV
jgi:hypothetical protein